MAACQDVRTWITQNVLVPVTQFISEMREKCDQFHNWVEEWISRPVERWIAGVEQRCRALPWWNPLRWFCELVTVFFKVVEWVVVKVGKWVVTIVCQLITVVVGTIVTFIVRVLAWVVTFVVCVTDPLDALRSFRDLWVILVDTVEDVLDLVELLLEDVAGILTDLEHLIDSLATSLGWLGVVLGIVKAVIQLVRDVVNIVKDVVAAATDILVAVLNLNLCGVIRGLADLITSAARALMQTAFAGVALLLGAPYLAGLLIIARVVGAVIAGIRDSVEQRTLDGIIIGAINGAFGAGTPRAVRSIAAVGVGAHPMGVPLRTDARRLFLSSNSRELDVGALHRAGVIDLYALAGRLSACGRMMNETEGEVVYAGTDMRVSYADIVTFLQNGQGSVPEFRVYAITRARFRSHLEAAQRKAETIGIQIYVRSIGDVAATSSQDVPLNAGEDNPPGLAAQEQLLARIGRTASASVLGVVPAVNHFHYVLSSLGREPFGLTTWHRPSIRQVRVSGVTYRSRSPDWVFRWVLAHELGHYWGLNHSTSTDGSRGLEEIMYAPSTGIGLTTSAVFEYLLGGGEPRFTLDDALVAWAWITTDGAAALLP